MIKVINCKTKCFSKNVNIIYKFLSQLAENQSTNNLKTDEAADLKILDKPFVNVPFMKNLFVGKFDANILIFPEALSKTEVQEINAKYNLLQSTLLNLSNKEKNMDIDFLKSNVNNEIKNFGLYGLKIPKAYGGMELSSTGVCRLNELSYLNQDVFGYVLNFHYIISHCIHIFANDQQKEFYLPKLASGEITGALCISEANAGTDLALIESSATLSEDGVNYLLKGEKIWVTNGPNADFFIVFAKTKVKIKGKYEDKLSAFLVDSHSHGISKSDKYIMANFAAGEICTIQFNDVVVPVENLINEAGNGYDIAFQTVNSNLFQVGSTNAAILRNISRELVNHCIERKQFTKSLKDFGLIQNKLSRISMSIYVMESMSYMTAGIIDSYKHPDILVECAAVKVLSNKLYKHSLADAMQILGCNSLKSESNLSKLIINAHANHLHITTDEILKLFISLSCLQHAGVCLMEDVKKFRNPLNNIGFIWKKSLENFRDEKKLLSKKLYNYVHPDLSHCGEALELRLLSLQKVVVKYWSSYGTEEMRASGRGLEEQQFSLEKFADMAIDIYAATACLARATRSKAIGLRNNDHEILIARTYAFDTIKRIDSWIADLDLGSFQNGDFNMIKMAELTIKNSEYAAEHPLMRNW